MSLTNLEIDFFRRSGYLLKKELVREETLESILLCISKIVDLKIPPFELSFQNKISKLSSVFQRNYKEILDVVYNEKILNGLTSLLGPNIDFLLNRHNHITFNRYGETIFRLHRDVLQWSRNVVTAIVYLEDSNLSNGCTHIVPTSQYLPFVGTPNNGGTWMDEHSVYKDLISKSIPVIAEKGDVLFMDSLMFHSVGMNNSNQSRISLNLAYTSVDELLPLDYSKYRILVKGERLYRGNIF